MLKIKNTIIFAAFICSLIMCLSASRAAAQQNFIPPGSYQKSCKNIRSEGAQLSASCGNGQSDLSKAIAGKDLYTTAPLTDYFECDGDIWNDHGQFKCNRSISSALMLKAKAAMDDSYKEVFGGKLELIGYEDGYKPYLRKMFSAGYAPQFFAGTLGSFLGKNARTFFIDYLNGNGNVKMQRLDEAFKYVYSTGISPKDLAYYNAQKVTFAQVVSQEKKKMLADKVIHRLAIAYAYKKVYGRNPTEAEFGKWTGRDEAYQEIIDAERGFLYSPAGAKELTETVKRHFADIGKSNSSIAEINQAIVKYTKKKAIYDEMN